MTGQSPPTIIFNIFGTSTEKDPHHGVLESIIYSESGQPLTKFRGCSYLFKGYPDHRIMGLLDISKDVSWIMANILRKRVVLLAVILGFIFFRPLAKKLFISACDKYFKITHDPMMKNEFIPKEGKQYCQAVKELYRVSQEMISEVKDEKMREIFYKFRDLVLMVLELDTAYRFKFQDVLPEINVERLNKDPIKEVRCILNLIQLREFCGDQKVKWDKVKKPLLLFLRISRKRKKQLIRFFSLLNYHKIKIDEADWYFCLQRPDYNYRGMSIEKRIEERKKIDKEQGHDIPVVQIQQYNPELHKKLLKK